MMKEFAEEIKLILPVLKDNGTILYPTDTIWGIGCDATSVIGIKKIMALKKRDESKNFIILIDHESRLQTYVKEIPEQAWALIEYSEKPLTIIYDGARNLPPEVIADDGSVAIRITKDDFCRYLIGALRKPLVSTSANLSGQSAPSSFSDINDEVINGVDYVVNWRRNEKIVASASTIIRLRSNGQISFIRK